MERLLSLPFKLVKVKRSLLQARLGALSHQESESHLKAGTDVATQITVQNKSPTHSTIGDARKTRYRRKSKRGEGNFEVHRLSARGMWVGGVFKGVKCANNNT
jgi:hypothetical protein